MGSVVRVLVVDDTSTVRRLLTMVLDAESDIQVVGTAGTGEIALSRAAELRPDVVTLDLVMPGMGGMAALEEMRSRWPDLPVILFSELTGPDAAETAQALHLGASSCVPKPSRMSDRDAALAEVRGTLLPLVRALGRAHQTKQMLRTGSDLAASLTAAAEQAQARTGVPTPAPAAPPRLALPSTPSRPPGSTPPAGRAPAAVLQAAGPAIPVVAPPVGRVSRRPHAPVEVVVIGASTGGPNALSHVIQGLPADLPVPVVVVQHMPPDFTGKLAQRLHENSPLDVVEATEGTLLMPGFVYVAAGGLHLALRRTRTGVAIRLDDSAPEHSVRPAVDVTLRTAADVFGAGVLAVVLTGMGRDGELGAQAVHSAGGQVFVQDEASSIVWGMPGAVVRAGWADLILPLTDVASTIVDTVRTTRGGAK